MIQIADRIRTIWNDPSIEKLAMPYMGSPLTRADDDLFHWLEVFRSNPSDDSLKSLYWAAQIYTGAKILTLTERTLELARFELISDPEDLEGALDGDAGSAVRKWWTNTLAISIGIMEGYQRGDGWNPWDYHYRRSSLERSALWFSLNYWLQRSWDQTFLDQLNLFIAFLAAEASTLAPGEPFAIHEEFSGIPRLGSIGTKDLRDFNTYAREHSAPSALPQDLLAKLHESETHVLRTTAFLEDWIELGVVVSLRDSSVARGRMCLPGRMIEVLDPDSAEHNSSYHYFYLQSREQRIGDNSAHPSLRDILDASDE